LKKIEDLDPQEAAEELRCLLAALNGNIIPIYPAKLQLAMRNLDGKNFGQLFHLAQKIAKIGNLKKNTCRTFIFTRPSDGESVTFNGIKVLKRFRALLKLVRKKRDRNPAWR
jgi:hypothetical protein